jgi:hypothetical protein
MTTGILVFLLSASLLVAPHQTAPEHAQTPLRAQQRALVAASDLGSDLTRAAGRSVTESQSPARRLAVRESERPRHRSARRAAERAVERRLLQIAPESRLLVRFVDRTTGVVKRNVVARCARLRRRHRHSVVVFVCRVWQHPRAPSSGVRVRCRTKNKRFLVTAYRRARRH